MPQTRIDPRPSWIKRIKELTARVTDKAIERVALTKSWVLEQLRENAEKALNRLTVRR